jgi:LacI family transcriptional regulator
MGHSSNRITLKQIAEKAGVSPTAASIILNKTGNYRNMSPSTREKVERIARELGYQPNHMAKALRLRATKQIGLVIPNMSNLFMPPLINVTRKTADEHDYNLLLIDLSDMDNDQMRQRIQHVQSTGSIDGMVVHGCGEIISEVVKGIPAVYLDTQSCTPSICFTEEKASYELVELFVGQGLRKICFINADIERESFALREKGYRRAMRELGLPEENVKVNYFPVSMQGGEQAYHWVCALPEQPEAVIILADVMTYGFMLAARRDGKDIPDQLAVASIDDLEMSRLFVPSITCSHVNIEKMSRLAVKTLFDMINHNTYQERQVVETYVVERESSKKFKTK